MPLTKLQLRPGVVRDVPSYTNEGGWFLCDKIRFRAGLPEKIGGWTRLSDDVYVGTCTALFTWASLGAVHYMAAGTNKKYYIEYGGVLYDTTPIRKTTDPLGTDPVATSSGTTTLTITDTAHGAYLGDYVTISGITGPINGVPASEINAEHEIMSVPTANTYTVEVSTSASGTGSGGGAAGVAAYQLNTGLDVYVAGSGYGAGYYGEDIWGSAISSSIPTQLRLWSQGTFGEDLIFCDRDGGLYYWDVTTGVAVRSVNVSSLGGASDVPTVAAGVIVTDSRHVVAYGVNPIGSAQQDPMFVRWSDTESAVDWTPTATNTAGGYRLAAGSRILTARNSRLETLFWTDTALYSMVFIGGALEFSFNVVGTPITLMGPNAVALVGGTAFWMGFDKFYMYNGAVSTMECPLLDILTNNVNRGQAFQVFAGTNEHFGEVTWFYCSTDSDIVDSYITYNYTENLWYYGTMNRSAWVDAGMTAYPVAADNAYNVLVYHEVGADDLSSGSPVGITSYIESSDFDLGDGHQFMFVSRILPDIKFVGSTASSPAVTLVLKTRNSSGGAWNTSDNQPTSSGVTRTAQGTIYTSPFEQYTEQVWVRTRGRQAAFRIESSDPGVRWQLGAVRLDIRPDGRR